MNLYLIFRLFLPLKFRLYPNQDQQTLMC